MSDFQEMLKACRDIDNARAALEKERDALLRINASLLKDMQTLTTLDLSADYATSVSVIARRIRIDECEACQKAERLPRPQTEPIADKRTVGISLALAKVSLMGLENHARTIRCKLSMLGIAKSTRETLNHDLGRYNAAIRELKGVIRAATIN